MDQACEVAVLHGAMLSTKVVSKQQFHACPVARIALSSENGKMVDDTHLEKSQKVFELTTLFKKLVDEKNRRQ